MAEPIDTPESEGDQVISSRVRASEVLLMLGSIRAEVRVGADAARRTEAAVGDLARRVGALEADVAGLKADVANGRREADAARPPRTSAVAVVAVIIAALAVLVPVLLDAYHS